jgi:hypothetical protein
VPSTYKGAFQKVVLAMISRFGDFKRHQRGKDKPNLSVSGLTAVAIGIQIVGTLLVASLMYSIAAKNLHKHADTQC